MEGLKIGVYASSKLQDNVVVKRVLAGERELFEILLRRYNQTLYRVIRSYLKDENDVQDAMQNAYLKAFDKLYQFQGNAAFSTWLIRIGINESLLRLKDIKKGKVIYLDPAQADPEMVNQIPDKQMNPERAVIQRESRQLLEQCIDNLPEKYRVVYILKEIEGLDNTQVGESLGLSDSNVKVRLHRAKSLLKESLYKLSVGSEVFEFGNNRCDAIVHYVMKQI